MKFNLQKTRAILGSKWVRIGGTFVGIAFLIHSVDLKKAFASLFAADWHWLILAATLTALVCLASVFEWAVLLRSSAGLGIRNSATTHPDHHHHHRLFGWGRLSSMYLQSLFFAQLLPAGVGGDAMRTVEMGKAVGHGKVLASLAGSRMAGTLGMALWGLAAAVLLRSWLGISSLVGASVFAGLMILAWLVALMADRLFGHHYFARSQRAFIRTLHSFAVTFSGYRRSPRALFQCLVIGAAGWGLNILALTIFARAIGADVSWTVFAVAIPITLIVTLAPFSVNGLGLREGVLMGMLTHAGVSAPHAIAIAVLVDLQMLPFGLFGAVLWLRHRHRMNPQVATGIPQETLLVAS